MDGLLVDGLLVIDKPAGPTSHDVVARVRRALGERRIGHTGTLDPLASGVLPLVIGRATRLARFLSGADKQYEALITLGRATDTYDTQGTPLGSPYRGDLPSREHIDRTLDAFRGAYLQQPPLFSAKKIGGVRSYVRARRERARGGQDTPDIAVTPDGPATPAAPAAVPVWASVQLLEYTAPTLVVAIECSAGFYVRSLAHDLGTALGTGAHLTSLRRIRSGAFMVDEAVPLGVVERDRTAAASALMTPARMLAEMPARTLTPAGLARTRHGQPLGAGDFEPAEDAGESIQSVAPRIQTWAPGTVRLLNGRGELVAIAQPIGGSGLLHPALVLM